MSTTPSNPFADHLDAQLSDVEARLADLRAEQARIEQEVRDFGTAFPTPNVLRAIALCEEGRLDWSDAHRLLNDAVLKGLAQVPRD